jgi:mevalonate kinase
MNQLWSSRAPGSLMLFGEHAVLHGKPAIACAIDHWLNIQWQRREDNQLHIITDFIEHKTNWQTLATEPKLSFVMKLLDLFRQQFPKACQQGLNLTIRSDINSTQGLGSSSAVVAAMVTGLSVLTNSLASIEARFQLGLACIRSVQGTGSGTDLAVALNGGIIRFDPSQLSIQRIADQLPIVSVYCGYKTPTPQVIRQVETLWTKHHPLFEQWLNWISYITNAACDAIQHNNLAEVGRCMNMAHGLMHGLGVSDSNLDAIAYRLRAYDGLYGAKISGSGLGDCVIGLGTPSTPLTDALSVHTSPIGAHCF